MNICQIKRLNKGAKDTFFNPTVTRSCKRRVLTRTHEGEAYWYFVSSDMPSTFKSRRYTVRRFEKSTCWIFDVPNLGSYKTPKAAYAVMYQLTA